jgi:hypothetical protein
VVVVSEVDYMTTLLCAVCVRSAMLVTSLQWSEQHPRKHVSRYVLRHYGAAKADCVYLTLAEDESKQNIVS